MRRGIAMGDTGTGERESPNMPSSDYDPECWSCQHLLGQREISPAPRIHDGRYWIVEHAPRTSIVGWTVIVLKRHARALHEIEDGEYRELTLLLRSCCEVVHQLFSTEHEYVVQFTESEHYHLHVHLIPRAPDLRRELRGPGVFRALGEGAANKISADEMTEAAIRIRDALRVRLA